jgi:hypothetical protein
MMREKLKTIYHGYCPEWIQMPIRKIRGLRPTTPSPSPAIITPPRSWHDIIRDQYELEFCNLMSRLKADSTQVQSQKILFYSMIPWHQGGVEHMISAALRLRGHDTISVVCGGLLPDCEMHYYDYDRPSCPSCLENARRVASAFGIEPLLSTEFLDDKDLLRARLLVDSKSREELLKLTYDGINVGQLVRFQMNTFYQNFLIELDEVQWRQFRIFCQSAILLTDLARRLLETVQPDLVVEVNGKAFTFRPFFLVAREKGIRTVVWEEHAFDNEMKFVFNHNCYPHEIKLDLPWKNERQTPLTKAEVDQVDSYFTRWRNAEITPFEYHANTTREAEFMFQKLGITAGASLIGCFPNMLRDSSAFDRDIAFDSMLDWLLQTVDLIGARPDVHLIIKAHPGERCLPEQYAKYNRFFVCEAVRNARPDLPENIHLLEGDSAINTYTVMEHSDVICVYTSTVGIEAALSGRLACVVGDVHYRDKGFTMDISRPEDLWNFLKEGPPYPRSITQHQVRLTKKYAHMWRFRYPFNMPFYDPETISFAFPRFEVLAPGGDPIIEKICHCAISGHSFIDMD